MRFLLFLLASTTTAALLSTVHARPHLLLITVDDMSADSIGAFGCALPDTSPHVDRLAGEGMKFLRAHVQVGNCYPSRNVMWTGLYPHNSGVEGFYQVRPIDYPHLVDVMKAAGYYVAIRGKVSHSTPYQPYPWDDDLTLAEDGGKEHMKDVDSYHRSTRRGIEKAAAEGKPFCLNINISDPHKPFWKPGDPHPASREFTAEEVPVPGFLFDDPAVREELALYYTSVRRADDAVGAILRALEESGEADDTFVMFLSDHGMPLPFAKTQLYHHSTRTPLVVRWPGRVEPGSVDADHFVSAIDFLPTICEVAGIEPPDRLDGLSFAPLLLGEAQEGRDSVYKVYNENAGGKRHPMRGVETADYLYLFNPWSDGEDRFRTATQGTATYRRMRELAQIDETIAARLELFDHRVVEELYDVGADPDCLSNLAGAPAHAEALASHRARLRTWMEHTGDPLLAVFEARDSPGAMREYVDAKQAESDARRKKKKTRRAKGGNRRRGPKGKAGE